MELAGAYAKYGVLADSEWAREMARRQILLATYGMHENGVVEDNIDGGQIVAGNWFKIAHPMALKHVLQCMAWLPEVLGANRENHLMRTSAVVTNVVYGKGRVAYSTFDAPSPCLDVLRLAFRPKRVTADGKPLAERRELDGNGFQVTPLEGGDCLVSLRHDGCRQVVVEGNDPQQIADDTQMQFEGGWSVAQSADDLERALRVASAKGTAVSFHFTGNQVRLVGAVGSDGGMADVYVDDEKQLVGIDCWCPQQRRQQILYYKSGLARDGHTLKIVVRGTKNPLSRGTHVYVDAIEWSNSESESDFGEGGGPTDPQRVLFGYTGRTDYVDSRGNAWRPATEFILRLRSSSDVVRQSWLTAPRAGEIANVPDSELYRHGVLGRDLTVYFTVGPGTYHARLKFADSRDIELKRRLVSVEINGEKVVGGIDIAATAGGPHRAVDLVFNDIRPKNGVLAIRLWNRHGGEAIVQAIEVGPGEGGTGADPVCVDLPIELVNGDFEDGVNGAIGGNGSTAGDAGWTYVFHGKQRSYVWRETGFDIHPEWGPPKPRTGREALRTHTDADGHNVVYQDIEVQPGKDYVASAWVRALDLHGKGFGKSEGDSTGLLIHELDENGEVLVHHPKSAITEATDYVRLEHAFTAQRNTAAVRFILDTVIGCKYDQGSVTYDDCALTVKSNSGD